MGHAREIDVGDCAHESVEDTQTQFGATSLPNVRGAPLI